MVAHNLDLDGYAAFKAMTRRHRLRVVTDSLRGNAPHGSIPRSERNSKLILKIGTVVGNRALMCARRGVKRAFVRAELVTVLSTTEWSEAAACVSRVEEPNPTSDDRK